MKPPFTVGGPKPVDVDTAISNRMSNATPMSEATGGSAGAAQSIPRDDHQHPRLTSTTPQLSGANGQTTIAFTRGFTKEPGSTFTVIEANTNPVPDFKVMRWLRKDGADWVSTADQTVDANQIWGCVVYGQRARANPVLNLGGIVLIGPLLTALGVLSGYAPYMPLETGTKFTAIIIASSQP